MKKFDFKPNNLINKEGDLFTKKEWLEHVESRCFIDYDGYGYACKDGRVDREIQIYPSEVSKLDLSEVIHILWFNR